MTVLQGGVVTFMNFIQFSGSYFAIILTEIHMTWEIK